MFYMYKKIDGKVESKLFKDGEKAPEGWVDCPTKVDQPPKKRKKAVKDGDSA